MTKIAQNQMYVKFECAKNENCDLLTRSSEAERIRTILEPHLEAPSKDSPMGRFFGEKSVFVTGASGFFGKILVEKLLRSCPGLETVYILIREKKGKDIHTRTEELYGDMVFSQLAKQQPKFRHKIVAVKGDVSLPGLGMSDSDRKMITEKVSIIYHAAATVRFDEKLKMAVAINIKGTKEMLDLARECPKLVSMVHVSTAFAYCPQRFIGEEFYEPPMTTDDVISLVDTTMDKDLDDMTPKLLGEWPNTYAYTKAIAEETVKKYGQGLPICVFRPSIVIATYKEPLRGWIDNLYGPTGAAVAAGTGVLRTLHCDGDVNAETVPIDYVVNALIAASYKNYREKCEHIPIYNYVSSVEKPIKWRKFMDINQEVGMKTPTVKAIYYCSVTLNKNRYVNFVYMFFLHVLPALLIDAAMIVTGKKPRTLKLYKKVHKFMEVISYFCTRQWTFKNDNVQKLWNELDENDKKTFAFSMKDFDWAVHSETHMPGVRVFLVKDSLDTLPEARRKWRKLFLLHYTLKLTVTLLALRLLYSILTYIF